MNDTINETRQNRYLLYLIFAVLVLLSVFFLKFYQQQKKENSALRIKILTLSKSRTVTPWQRLITKPQIAPTVIDSTNVQDKVSTSAASTIAIPALSGDEPPIENLTTEALATSLTARMNNVKSQSFSDLEKNIQMADEIISREPDSYLAYKAKLISLLIEEGKLNRSIDDNVINGILETMASFNLTPESVTQKEAALLSSTNEEIDQLAGMLDQVSGERQSVELEMELQDENSANKTALEIQRYNLLSKEEELTDKLNELSTNVNIGFPPDQYLNEEVVQIPFLRMMAKNDFEGVIDNASTFVQQFPESPEGYFFLIKAYQALGREDEALRTLEDSSLSTEARNALDMRLKNSSGQDPKLYWQRLSF